jgi:hypothetical protein
VLDIDGERVPELDGELVAGLDGDSVTAAADGRMPDGAGAEMSEATGGFGHPVSNNTRVRRKQTAAADRSELRMESLLDRVCSPSRSPAP